MSGDERTLIGDLVSVSIDAAHGGRLSSLRCSGEELLVSGPLDDVFAWGAYPMVPYAGRVRSGEFMFGGESYKLPITMPPHAIHGTGLTGRWEWTGPGRVSAELGPRWPFGGSVTHTVSIDGSTITCRLEVTAGEVAMPVMAGWHPWFRRVVGNGRSARLESAANRMWELDAEAIPTGRLVEAPQGPWDNCFDGYQSPSVVWEGFGQLRMSSDCSQWVIYDKPDHAICVEPQSGAPDEFNRSPVVLAPGETSCQHMILTWSPAR